MAQELELEPLPSNTIQDLILLVRELRAAGVERFSWHELEISFSREEEKEPFTATQDFDRALQTPDIEQARRELEKQTHPLADLSRRQGTLCETEEQGPEKTTSPVDSLEEAVRLKRETLLWSAEG